MWAGIQMPILYLIFGILAMIGLAQVPQPIRSFLFTGISLLVTCIICGFVWAVVKNWFLKLSGRKQEASGTTTAAKRSESTDSASSSYKQPVADPKAAKRVAEEAALLEDDFLRHH